MISWKSAVKTIGVNAGKGIAKGTRLVVDETSRRIKDNRRKKQIVARMYPNVVKYYAFSRGLHPKPFNGGRPTIDDYRNAIASNVSIDELIVFANKKRIHIRDITDEIDKENTENEIRRISADDSKTDIFREVAISIREFTPFNNYTHEYAYQAELAQWLKSRFPGTELEVQRGSSRPDIVIKGIAIEVKGPTHDEALVTIADKCMRYPEHFKAGITIVLFNVRTTSYRYNEWLNSIKKTFGYLSNFEIIKI